MFCLRLFGVRRFSAAFFHFFQLRNEAAPLQKTKENGGKAPHSKKTLRNTQPQI
jgi:hypothetical protein